MNISNSINEISVNMNFPLSPAEVEEIIFLLENDVSLYHLSKINLDEAIEDAILYISPDF